MKKTFLFLVFASLAVVSEVVAQRTTTLYGIPAHYYPDGEIQCGKKNGICAEITTNPPIFSDEDLALLEPMERVILKVFLSNKEEEDNKSNFVELFIKPNFEIKNTNGQVRLKYTIED